MHLSNFRNGGKLTFRGGNLTWGNFTQKMGDHPLENIREYVKLDKNKYHWQDFHNNYSKFKW